MPEPLPRVRVQREDWTGAIAVFLLVFLSTFPVVVPFLFMSQARGALRISNLIAIVMLFGTGWVFGRITGRAPELAGAFMVLLGAGLVGLTIALGG
ncbi:MAG: VIT1/CCC1 transporter family protein [Verrucomicrobia bacterium]|nr:VIT1/CCC1 transporter family protein [Verrucomicrobiota bacterium]